MLRPRHGIRLIQRTRSIPLRLDGPIGAAITLFRGHPLTSQGGLISDIDSGLDTLLLGVEIVLDGESAAGSHRRMPRPARHVRLPQHNLTPSLASSSPVLSIAYHATGACSLHSELTAWQYRLVKLTDHLLGVIEIL
jgi:hypothetical protein